MASKKKPVTLGKRLAKLESDAQVDQGTLLDLAKLVNNLTDEVDKIVTSLQPKADTNTKLPESTWFPETQKQIEGRVNRVGSEEKRREFEDANTLLLHIDRHISTLRQERRSLYDKWTEGKVTQEELDAFGLKIREECVKRRKVWRNGTHFWAVHESMRAKLESNKRINNSAKIEARITREKRRAEIGVIVSNNDNHFSRNQFYKDMVIAADNMASLTDAMLSHFERTNNMEQHKDAPSYKLYLELCSHHQRITSVDIA
jgi:hypothetical protein